MQIKFYYRPDCGHCRKLSATLDKIIEERKYTVKRLNADKYGEIVSVPTVVIFYKGQEIGRFTSALDKAVIDKYLDELEDYVKEYLK